MPLRRIVGNRERWSGRWMRARPRGIWPVGRRHRIRELDIVRGVALLGILVVNIQEHMAPARHLTDSVALLGVQILAVGKFYPLFALLFGLGSSLQFARMRGAGAGGVFVCMRRFMALYVIGAAFYVFVDHNDILITLGIAGWMCLVFSRCHGRWLRIASVLCLAVAILYPWSRGGGATTAPRNVGTAARSGAAGVESRGEWHRVRRERPYREWVRRRAARYFGDWPVMRWDNASHVSGLCLLALLGGRAWSVERICRYGAERRSVGRWLTGVGLVGAGFVAASGLVMEYGGPVTVWVMGVIHKSAGPVLGVGYAATVVGLAVRCRGGFAGWVASAGQMALTNFIGQSVVMIGIFYGLGVEGAMGPTAGALMAGVIWLVQVWASGLWLRRFCFGPVEYVWRTITYWEVQPWARGS